jgi:short-subunit dehydrogenase
LARQYAQDGAQLGLVGRNIQRLQTLAELLSVPCAVYQADVRDAASMQQAGADFITRFGLPDIVIANAGVSRGTLTERPEDAAAFRTILEINVLGMVHTFLPFVALMRQQRGGQLVGIASVAGIRGLPGASAYSSSKAAAVTYLESLRTELSQSGVSVTTICPGYIRTPMTDVNDYRMPFMMEVDAAAKKMVKIIDQKRRFAILPWQMAIIARLMRVLPAPVWDWLTRRAPRKPRLEDRQL